MILPNKVIKYEESIIGKIPFLLEHLTQHDEYNVGKLYVEVSDRFEDINQFILALDVLYILDALEYFQEKGVLKYVART